MLVQRQETEQELNQRIQKLSTEKSSLVERVASLQRTLANMETEKREIERQVSRQEKDKSALKKTLDKVNIVNTFLCKSHQEEERSKFHNEIVKLLPARFTSHL